MIGHAGSHVPLRRVVGCVSIMLAFLILAGCATINGLTGLFEGVSSVGMPTEAELEFVGMPTEAELEFVGSTAYSMDDLVNSDPGTPIEQISSYTVSDVRAGDFEPIFVLEDSEGEQIEVPKHIFGYDYAFSSEVEIVDEVEESIWLQGEIRGTIVGIRITSIFVDQVESTFRFSFRYSNRGKASFWISEDDMFVWEFEDGVLIESSPAVYEDIPGSESAGSVLRRRVELLEVLPDQTYHTVGYADYSALGIGLDVFTIRLWATRELLRGAYSEIGKKGQSPDVRDFVSFDYFSAPTASIVRLSPLVETRLVRRVERHTYR